MTSSIWATCWIQPARQLRRRTGSNVPTSTGDENLRLALAHLIQIIGEAARHVSDEARRKHPEIPWTAIIGMRHKVVHDYLEVDEDIVWDVVTADLPPIVTVLERIVSPF